MKKVLMLVLVVIIILAVGCKKNTYGLDFKKEYESLNGEKNKNGKEHRTLTIDEDNPYQKVSTSDILKRIENKETFYVYFGDRICPWCRSVIEKSIEVAKKNKVDKVYYVAIWNDEGEEIVRDKYEIKDGILTKTIEGTKDYEKLLEIFNDLLKDYTVTDSEGQKYETGEKRIYAPNYIYVEKGVPKTLVTGISEKQTDSREELTTEILKDEEQIFNNFFKTSK